MYDKEPLFINDKETRPLDFRVYLDSDVLVPKKVSDKICCSGVACDINECIIRYAYNNDKLNNRCDVRRLSIGPFITNGHKYCFTIDDPKIALNFIKDYQQLINKYSKDAKRKLMSFE